jgi:hypothetical protein
MLKDYVGLYDVDQNGNVTNLKTGKILKPSLDTKGYPSIDLSKNGESKTHTVHRLVAEKYLSNFCTTLQVDHIDQCKTNNCVSNLRMVTNQQNNFNKKSKGYYFHKPSGKWMAYITLNGKKMYLGYYNTEAEAATSYAVAKVKYHII